MRWPLNYYAKSIPTTPNSTPTNIVLLFTFVVTSKVAITYFFHKINPNAAYTTTGRITAGNKR